MVLLGVFSKGHGQLGCTPCGQGAPLGMRVEVVQEVVVEIIGEDDGGGGGGDER